MKSYFVYISLILSVYSDCNMIYNESLENVTNLRNLKKFIKWYFAGCTCLTIFNDDNEFLLDEIVNVKDFSLRIASETTKNLTRINSTQGFLILSGMTGNILNRFKIIRDNIDGIVRKMVIATSIYEESEYLTLFNYAYELSFQNTLIIVIESNCSLKIVSYNPFADVITTSINISEYQEIYRRDNINLYNTEIRSVKNFVNSIDMDMFLTNILSEKLNFTVSYFAYQEDTPNKTSDVLRKLVRRYIDFLFSPVFVTDYSKYELTFLEIIAQDELCVIVPKSKEFRRSFVIPRCFTMEVWILLAIFFLILLSSLYNISKMQEIRKRGSFDYRIQTIIVDGLQIILNISRHFSSRKYPNRIFFLIILLFLVVLNTTFQSSLYRILSMPNIINNINTLEELAESGLRVSTKSDNLKNTFNGTGKSYMKEIKLILLGKNQSKLPAYLERHAINTYEELMDFRKFGDTQRHLIPECPKQYGLAHIARKDSILADAISKIISRIIASGLIKKWRIDVMNNISMYTPYDKHIVTTANTKQFKIIDFLFCFIILIVGLSVSGFIFLVEVILAKYSKK